ncbi:MAG TPA: DNA helicase PcrA [Candidatus Pullilachnospira stercoravium]|uniref:ATP-dependent DNA helicase n=1 Tax=Candidatus Pullilachnospira stercoravium TaxID=2840913 RepID=A0A9D1NW25_9FIRM|nr:DNA helicase PcrA [Candidatus Pullilachnospira stercoravium]
MSKYEGLNPMQQEAVYHTEGPVLILAGAGSGKTRVLTHRIAYLIEEKSVNPWNIMAITFTNKAAQEMRERVDQIVGFGSESIWVSTFHSSCVRMLRRFIDRIGYENNFTIYDTDDQKTVIKEVCKRLNIDTKMFKERSLMAAISSAKDELISPEAFKRDAGQDWSLQTVARVYEAYQKQLAMNNALDFDDLIAKTVELLEASPEVLDYYQQRFRYIMVDEYQDTNTAQFRFVSLLASKYRNLCVVGDDDQSIYKFRGANIGNILGYEKVFPDAKVIKLEQNYRSTQNILNAANEVIRHNLGRKEKTLWTDNEVGELLHFRQFLTGYEEAEYIAGDISKKVREGTYAYRDCAILYRTNAQSRLFEEKFLLANIPYKIVGGVNFYARKEIKDLLAYLKTIDNARDDVAVRRIINVPKRGIGATTLNRVQDYAQEQGISFYDALKEADQIPTLGRSAAKIRPFVDFVQKFRSQLEYLSVTELLNKVIEETGYVEELKAEDTEESRARIENIDELISKVVSYEQDAEEPSLDGFLSEVALIADIDSVEESDNRVLLMTLHSAKGLEFPNVYLAGMEDGIFPSYMTITEGDASELEEERRLCYVGITRAMKELTLTAAQQRMIRGETQYSKVSRFIREIPRELVELGRETAPKKTVEMPQAGSSYARMRQVYRKETFAPKKFEVKKAEALDYGVGDTVRHIKFGTGTVTAIAEGGKDYEVTVDFDRVGTKKMFASFAKLKKI